jgi:calcium-dependent protein kinase
MILAKILEEIEIMKQLVFLKRLKNRIIQISIKCMKFFKMLSTIIWLLSKCFVLKYRYVEGGELLSFMEKQGILSLEMAADVMRQILSAVLYCHKRGIVHRDLKPQNILISSQSSTKLAIKIIDFGTAGWFSPNTKMIQTMGSSYYIAPEVLDQNYDEKCDVWSSGVILYLLLSGVPPFKGRNDEQILQAVKKGKYTMSGI